MPLFQNRVRAEIADNPNRQSLLFCGTGFVALPHGRVFVPLAGRPRLVPSQQEELRYRSAFPRIWHCWLFAIVSVFIGKALANVLSPPLPQDLVNPLPTYVIVIAIAAWYWRRVALISAWQVVEQPEVSRSKLVLASLESWSVVPLSLTFVSLVALGLLVFPEMRITSEGSPLTATDPNLWLLIAVIAFFVFAYLRAVFWLMVALGRRVRRWAVQES